MVAFIASGIGFDSYRQYHIDHPELNLSPKTTRVDVSHRSPDGGTFIESYDYHGLSSLERTFFVGDTDPRKVIRNNGQWTIYTFPEPDEKWKKLAMFL